MKLFAWRALFFVAFPPLVALSGGCANQGEGDRCTQASDCDIGFYCKQVYLNNYYNICCPVSGGQVSVAACNASGGPAPISDASTDRRNPDATSDSADATSETSSPEAGVDAPAETGNDDVTNDTPVDNGVDITRDVPNETTNGDAPGDTVRIDQASPDATSDDGSDDAAPDVTDDGVDDVISEPSLPDAPFPDVGVSTDAADAVSADGPG